METNCFKDDVTEAAESMRMAEKKLAADANGSKFKMKKRKAMYRAGGATCM
jgi:hypothetical protein